MGYILKEAIADAKAVRETALENAKMALEEAFTPQIKSMLSAKLKEDDDVTDEVPVTDEDEDEAEEGMHGDEVPAEEGSYEEAEEVPEVEPVEVPEVPEVPEVDVDVEPVTDEVPEEGDIEDLDLEAVIAELEAELSGEEDEEVPVAEGEDEEGEEIEEEYEIDEVAITEDDDEEEETVDEVDKSSGIGKGTGRGNTDTSSGIGNGSAKLSEIYEVQAELNEYKEAVHFLKDKLHEVNILNAKLLFTNKLFKQYSLDNNQKLKVVETFDRAQTTREIKLVYSTLAEQFSDNGSIINKKSINESASKAVASTKHSKESSKVITEESNVANRFRKLAGIIK